MKKTIFGKIWEIDCEDKELFEILKKELSFYENSKLDFDVNLKIIAEKTEKFKKTKLNNEGFEIHYSNNNFIIFDKSDIKKVYIEIIFKREPSAVIDCFKRLYSIGYENTISSVGRVLHEAIFVPFSILYFNSDIIPIHSSAVYFNQFGGTVVLAGKGGAGKTSLEQYFLSKYKNTSFVSDDMTIIDLQGNVHTNYNYPKIYGYNVKNGSKLEKTIMKNRGIIDRIHWKVRSRISGDRVRRRMNPIDLYKKDAVKISKVKIIIYICTDNSIIDINSDEKKEYLIQNIVKTIFNEYYSVLFKKLRKSGKQGIYNVILNRYSERVSVLLNKCEYYIINIRGKTIEETAREIKELLLNEDIKDC